ncbi:MAG: hypothetical protein GWP15_00485 [Nitrospirae bacterium]|nr:hypothetical protein [Nitrospirota bacterium]
MQTPKVKEKILAVLLTIVLMLFGYYLYKQGRVITGPFIFADELEYFSYARDLFLGKGLSDHVQYGILYPAIGSLFFYFGNVETVYSCLRIFNIAILLSSAIPAFLLVRAWLPNSLMLFFFPLLTVMAPFSGYVYLIWAEPLYYTLFLWTAFALFSFYRNPRILCGVVVGILLSLLFHAKPGAGIVVQFAAFFSLISLVFRVPSGMRRRLILPIFLLVLSCLLLMVPWMIRNYHLDVGPIGYGSHTLELDKMIAEFGHLKLAMDTFRSLFFQLTYVFIGTWGLFGVLFLMLLKRWRLLLKEDFTLIVFTLLCISGLIFLSAFGMSTFHGLSYWMPNGRYLAVTFPLLILLSMGVLARIPNNSERKRFALISVMLVIIAIFATPLGMLSPSSFVNNAELALPAWIIDGGLTWRGRYVPAIYERIIFATAYGGIGLVLIWVSRWRRVFPYFIAPIFACSFIASISEQKLVTVLGINATGFNNVMRYALRKQIVEKDIFFDNEFKSVNTPFIPRFWTGSGMFKFIDRNKVVRSMENRSKSNFFISTKKIPLPIAYKSKGYFVYRVNLEN